MAAPTLSPARLAANRANARKSTGPRTEAGKARSRANAVKHGLTGAGVALPGEAAAPIQAEFLQAQEEFAPTTLAGMKLVRDVALLWVRQDRARRFEAAVLDRRTRHAATDFDRARLDRADGLIDAIEAHPRAYRRALLLMPEGVDRLIDALTMLLDEIAAPVPTWGPAHHKRLDALFGFRPDDLPWHRPTRFSRAVNGDFSSIAEAEVEGVAPADRPTWAMIQLIGVIEAEVDRLVAHRATIDLTRIADDRADAVALAHLDPGPDGALAHRYVTAAARDLSRTLRDLHQVEARYGTDLDPETETETETETRAEAEVSPEPPPIAGADPEPGQDSSPNLLANQGDTPPVASFGGPPPAAPIVDPVPAAPAPAHAVRPVHTAEPAVFYPSIRQ